MLKPSCVPVAHPVPLLPSPCLSITNPASPDRAETRVMVALLPKFKEQILQ